MSFSLAVKEKLKNTPHTPGVYLHKDRLGGIIYVGKAKDLRRRLGNYFAPSRRTKADRKTRALIETIADFDYHLTKNEQEALVLEAKLIKQYRPRYNIIFRDDKRFEKVRIHLNDAFPKFTITRIRKPDGAKYFGPFVHSTALHETMAFLNHRFGLRSCQFKSPGKKEYKHCHADVIRNCSAPCVGKISPADYLKRCEAACDLLNGKGRRDALKEITIEMQEAAADLKFERAAKLRDVIENMTKTLEPVRQFRNSIKGLSTVKPTEDLAELGEFLQLDHPPYTMECFDISNVSSTHIVASMVRFTNGAPDNAKYRRYRITTVKGQDDFASMAEVVRRRYRRLLQAGLQQAEKEQIDPVESPVDYNTCVRSYLPNLIIVDGGKGQLSSAVRELKALGIEGQAIIGLAKRREEVFFPGESDPLLIPHDKGALKLLQRIRDEAHRFANNYNELLLRKRIKESILDDCPDISPRKKTLLLQKFGSVTRLRKASVAEVATIHGISEKGASKIMEWLKDH